MDSRAVIVLASVVAGIVMSAWIGVAWAGVAVVVVSVVLGWIFPKVRDRVLYPMVIFGLGWMAGALSRPHYAGSLSGSMHLVGEVVSSVMTNRGERSVVRVVSLSEGNRRVDVDNVEMLLYSGGGQSLDVGDIVTGDVKVSMSEGSRRPELLLRGRTIGRLNIVGASSGVIPWAMRIRDYLSIQLDGLHLSPSTKGMLKALLLGDRSGMSLHGRSVFADAGVAHVMAVSGMHVGIIAAIILFLTRPLLLVGGYRWRYVLVAIMVWLFVLLTGLSYSAIRAATMITFAMMAYWMGRPRSGFPSVCWATVLILFCSPMSLYDAGLQLSFLCVASLTLFSERLNPIDMEVHPNTRRVVAALLTTLVATGATWLLSAWYFGRVPVHFLLANLIVLPLLPIYLSGALIYILLAACGLEISMLGRVVDAMPQRLFSMLDWMYGDSIMLQPSGISVLLWLGGMALLAISLHIHTELPAVGQSRFMVRYRVHGPLLVVAVAACLLSLILI